MAADSWTIERHEGTVGELHGLGLGESPKRTVRLCIPTDGALVLGSAQNESDVDREVLAGHGLNLVRRASGGGAVLVEPGDLLWIDVVLPREDSLWHEDVGTAFYWLGSVWKSALEVVGSECVTMHDGAMVKNEWSRLVCFAGLGPGECLVDDRKVVGISQRRTRAGAIFQSSVLLRFDPQRIVGLFQMSDVDAERALDSLAGSVASLAVSSQALEAAFLHCLEQKH